MSPFTTSFDAISHSQVTCDPPNMFTHVHLGTYLGMTPPRPVQTCLLCSQYIGQQVSRWHSSEMPSCYHLPMKLQEGNVFSQVCPSFCPLEDPHVAMIHVTIGQSQVPWGPLTIQGLPSLRLCLLPFNIQAPPTSKPPPHRSSNLFNLDLTIQEPPFPSLTC